MSHQRQAIRQAVKSQIGTGTGAGANVFTQQYNPTWQFPMPAILIYWTDEESAPVADQNPAGSRRVLDLHIEVRLQSSATLDDQLDSIAAEIEAQMALDSTMGGACSAIALKKTQKDVGVQGDTPIGALRLTYGVTYLA